MLFVTPVSGPLVFAVLEIPFHPLSTVMSGVRNKQGAIFAPQGAGITAGKRDHLRGCHVWQDVRSALVQAPQSDHGLRASWRLFGGCGIWTELWRKDMVFDRRWLGGRRKNDLPTVGNTMSRGMEAGNCRPCPARTWVWLEKRPPGWWRRM